MFCNSNEHSENGDWLQQAHCLEAWGLTHFGILSPSSCTTGVRCWLFSPLKMCLLSWMSGLSWGHFYQGFSSCIVLLSLHCSEGWIKPSEWASMAADKSSLSWFPPYGAKGKVGTFFKSTTCKREVGEGFMVQGHKNKKSDACWVCREGDGLMETLWKLQIRTDEHDPVQQKAATSQVLHRHQFWRHL